MADRDTISRVAKILARATSAEPHEAASALSGAYKRMVRDGVTLSDLLTLPIGELYQDALVKLIDVILADQANLSPVGKREAYAEYMRLIVEKFSGKSSASNDNSSRASEAEDYNKRNSYDESTRRQSSPPETPSANEFEHKNSQTQKSNRVFKFTFGEKEFSFSPARFWEGVRPLFGRGSLFWHTLHDPVHSGRLLAASLLWGMAFAMTVLTIAAFVHAVTNTGPLYDVKFKIAFSLLGAIGTIWKGRALFHAGWFR